MGARDMTESTDAVGSATLALHIPKNVSAYLPNAALKGARFYLA